MNTHRLLQLFALFIFITAYTAGCSLPRVKSDAPPVTHEAFSNLLSKHVSDAGEVDYSGLQNDSLELNEYLDVLKRHHPNKGWTSDERKAYWINAYNAFTLQLVIRNYPTESIKDLGGSLYKINTPWDIRFIYIEGQDYDLNNIEHDILRKEWKDPRIHFAVNCASVSCPILWNQAYEAAKLDEQLDEAAKRFINDPKRNTIQGDRAELSRIFKWFKGDFTREESLVAFINRYSNSPLSAEAEIEYLEYDWKLND